MFTDEGKPVKGLRSRPARRVTSTAKQTSNCWTCRCGIDNKQGRTTCSECGRVGPAGLDGRSRQPNKSRQAGASKAALSRFVTAETTSVSTTCRRRDGQKVYIDEH